MSVEKVFRVKGMHCSSCGVLIRDALSEIGGVEKVSADHKSGIVKVVSRTDVSQKAMDAIEKEGYKVEQ
ncbi:Heavy-metal-associated domain protein [uncultured archaeon]|nr:Heavy-metal-associated domain protein [uncultured archaeon]